MKQAFKVAFLLRTLPSVRKSCGLLFPNPITCLLHSAYSCHQESNYRPEKCLRVSSSVKGKPLPAPTSKANIGGDRMNPGIRILHLPSANDLPGGMSKREYLLLFYLKRLKILHQDRRGQVKTILMENLNVFLFHKSGSANK